MLIEIKNYYINIKNLCFMYIDGTSLVLDFNNTESITINHDSKKLLDETIDKIIAKE